MIQITVIAACGLTAGDQSATDHRMNNTIKPGAVLPPTNFLVGLPRDNAVAGRMHVSMLDFTEALFSDDEAIGDREEYFDDYAFHVWSEEQYNERSEPMSERCYCHRYNRYCGLCRPY